MSMAELRGMSEWVKSISQDNTVLVLWSPWSLIHNSIGLMESWGFKYKTGFPWVKVAKIQGDVLKPVYGMGFWIKGCSECILIGTKSKSKPPLAKNHAVGILGPRWEHSRKPDNIYEYAETLQGPYLELFARRSRPGWDVMGDAFGNDAKKLIRKGR